MLYGYGVRDYVVPDLRYALEDKKSAHIELEEDGLEELPDGEDPISFECCIFVWLCF